MSPNELSAILRSWNAWAPGAATLEEWEQWARGARDIAGSDLPSLKQVPPLFRRRLSKNGRVAFEIALNCADEKKLKNVELVFSSRHGESETTERLLRSIAANDSLSPNDFSLSVHNSVIGLFSIFTGNRLSSEALSARTSSFAAGLFEAFLRLQGTPGREVLYIYCDEQIPDLFVTDPRDVFPLHGVAFLLSSGQAEDTEGLVRIAVRYNAEREMVQRTASIPQQLEFLRSILLTGCQDGIQIGLGVGSLCISVSGGSIREQWRTTDSTL